jgi:hypothetical protein
MKIDRNVERQIKDVAVVRVENRVAFHDHTAPCTSADFVAAAWRTSRANNPVSTVSVAR